MKKSLKQNKSQLLIVGFALLCSLGFTGFSMGINAQTVTAQAKTCAPGQTGTLEVPCAPPKDSVSREPCKNPGEKDCDPAFVTDGVNVITDYLNPFLRLMTAIVGVVIVLSVVIAGIQYSAAGGDPSGVAAAKKRIMAAVIALIAYVFTFGFLQWLVPGGIV